MKPRSDHKFRRISRALVLTAAVVLLVGIGSGPAAADEPDPRIDLDPGWLNAETAISNLEHLAHLDKPPGFVDPANPGNFGFVTSDLAFHGNHAFMGNFNGFNIFDISDPTAPTVVTSVVCPGGQGDMSVHGNLLFMSVEESRARVDCGTNPTVGVRFQGVRIFDISNVAEPGAGRRRPVVPRLPHPLAGRRPRRPRQRLRLRLRHRRRPSGLDVGRLQQQPADGENPSRWRIEVIQVPLATPSQAAVVSEPRLFTDPATGAINGLQNTLPTPLHPSGMPWGPAPITDACHDITTFPSLGIAAGACEGNGILVDISDPANPVRIDEVSDPNFAYWHSATLSNDGTKVVFTDEWGGGTGARCRVTDQPQWGANAIFDIVDGQMQFASYYKLPVPQTTRENCVAHNGSLVPVPGRDILSQAWYQGGISLMDFTDSSNPKEIAFFDRGPISATSLVLGGFWSAYWYNGHIYGSEIARGFDVFGLTPSAHMSASEIAAAGQVQLAQFNPQHQSMIVWAPSFAVARSYYDQLVRAGDIANPLRFQVDQFLARAERFAADGHTDAAVSQLQEIAALLVAPQHQTLKQAILDLADSL